MNPRPEVVIDHDEIAQWCRDARAVADDIEKIVRDGVQSIMAAAIEEGARFTTDGAVSPIYRDPLAALESTLGVLGANAAVAVANIRADADFMEMAAANAAQIADDSAASVTGVDPDVSPTDRPTGRPGDPPGASRAMPVDPGSMAVDKSGGDPYFTTPMTFDDIPKALAPDRL